ncbi:iron-containing alcohol dehydrogenase [Luxibacter massiliensis]|uniref:iron-containing alcohol dehydrogenase n=1 Tax=Luxibacter massiliensis TaxID=2219695 RepID=UPI000F072537|nr:iron-containing alcohol dehydrogenase [Luxibacter massiliensis]
MKDFQLRNDTKLWFCNNPMERLREVINKKRVLFVYGGGSAKENGCFDDVKNAVFESGGDFYELGNSSRDRTAIEAGMKVVKNNQIQLVIGAGGASVMDCAKLIAFGACHEADWWEFVKGRKNPYGLERLPLVLMPTYPSSGSEYGLGAVSADSRTGDFGTAYGIAADYAILVPKYSLSLNKEMTAYTGLVTLVQLSASVIGDKNPISYAAGVSVICNVLKAVIALDENPNDLDARGVILYGASISTSGRLGIGKEENYAYDIYELEFVPEVLFDVPYRKSLTVLFPRFLKMMSVYHEDDIRTYIQDVFGYKGGIDESVERIVSLFEGLGISMYFKGDWTEKSLESIPIDSMLTQEEITEMIRYSMYPGNLTE